MAWHVRSCEDYQTGLKISFGFDSGGAIVYRPAVGLSAANEKRQIASFNLLLGFAIIKMGRLYENSDRTVSYPQIYRRLCSAIIIYEPDMQSMIRNGRYGLCLGSDMLTRHYCLEEPDS